ncbi:max dimerization protein 1-like [Dendronephthya gigantea]|uniref:max dimerization protein 1-like n=1 Tax=Dendronephthya gigantea TaxID=151771 RepID=UPI001069F57C|nr:max dimerization protein 1-like [Dendronephthya gigantea]
MGIEQLLAAAKLLEEQEAIDKRLRTPDKKSKRQNKRSPSYSRSTHNQLEKNRRAHLRDCLETLKEIVPTPPDHQKSTTLSLLQNARHYIKVLENTDKKAVATKEKLYKERLKLMKQLRCLKGDLELRIRKGSEGESVCDDEIDIEDTEYHSESDRCSTDGSGGSDGGL